MPHHDVGRVLIVGAGPTGLTLANTLKVVGIPFTIIDAKAGPSTTSKGLALNVASQYGFELIGMADQVGHSGRRVQRLNILWNGKRFGAIDFRHLDFHIKNFIMQPQSHTERQLAAVLEKKGHTIAWGMKLVSLKQASGHVDAVIQDGNGNSRIDRYAYVVGCDGKHSVVRDAMEAQFVGHDYQMHFLLGDFELNWSAPSDQVYYYVYPETFFILVPVDSKYWRVVVKRDGLVPKGKYTRGSDITDVVKRYLGKDIFYGEPRWLSRAAFYARTSDRLRRGRLLLAGDSAHLVSPIGGTGMNSGIQDALSLGWRLGHVLHGRARDSLLDAYETELLKIMQDNVKSTDISTKMIARIDLDSPVISQMQARLRNRSSYRSLLPRRYSGLGVAHIPCTLPHGGIPVGDSKPSGELCLGLGEILRLLRLAALPVPTGLLVGLAYFYDDMVKEEMLKVLTELSEMQTQYYDTTRWVVFLSNAEHAAHLASMFLTLAFLVIGPRSSAHIDGAAGALLLVFPDGVIGYSGSLRDIEELGHLMEARFIRHRSAPQLGEHAAGLQAN